MKKSLFLFLIAFMGYQLVNASSKHAFKLLTGATLTGLWGIHKTLETRIERERIIRYHNDLQVLHAEVMSDNNRDGSWFTRCDENWLKLDRDKENQDLHYAARDILEVIKGIEDSTKAARLALDLAVVSTKHPHFFGRSVTSNGKGEAPSPSFALEYLLAVKLDPSLDNRSEEV